MTCYRMFLLIIVLRFDAILYSKLGNENSDAVPIKCSREPQVPHMNWIDSHSRVDEGVRAGSCRINRLLFAEDLALLVSSQQGLQHALG